MIARKLFNLVNIANKRAIIYFCFIIIFLFICITFFILLNLSKVAYSSNFRFQEIDSTIYFTNGTLNKYNYGDRSLTKKIINDSVLDFYIYGDKIIYSNEKGLFISDINGKKAKKLLLYENNNFNKEGCDEFSENNGVVYFRYLKSETIINKSDKHNAMGYILSSSIYSYDFKTGIIKEIIKESKENLNNYSSISEKITSNNNIVFEGIKIIGFHDKEIYYNSLYSSQSDSQKELINHIKAISIKDLAAREICDFSLSSNSISYLKVASGNIIAMVSNIENDNSGVAHFNSKILKYSLDGNLISESSVFETRNIDGNYFDIAGKFFYSINNDGTYMMDINNKQPIKISSEYGYSLFYNSDRLYIANTDYKNKSNYSIKSVLLSSGEVYEIVKKNR